MGREDDGREMVGRESREKIRVLLADDHGVLRAGLAMLVGSQDDMVVVGEAGNGQEAVEKALELRPDVAVIDLSMPELNGIEAIRRLSKQAPDIRCLALTMHDTVAYVRTVVAAGSAGYVVKSAADAELLTAIRAVYRGRFYLDLSLADAGLSAILPQKQRRGDKTDLLSKRERQVLELIALGFTHREIADQVHLSIKTIETYRARLAEKLDLKSRAELVRFALDTGVLTQRSDLELIAGR